MVPLATIVADVMDSERLAIGEMALSLLETSRPYDDACGSRTTVPRFRNLVRNARQAIVARGQTGEITVAASEDNDLAHRHYGYRARAAPKGAGAPVHAVSGRSHERVALVWASRYPRNWCAGMAVA